MANAGIPSDYLIKQRRRQEDFRAYYEDAKKTQDRVAKKAEWENKTNKVIEENRLQGRVSALQAQVDGHLEMRRQRCHPPTHTTIYPAPYERQLSGRATSGWVGGGGNGRVGIRPRASMNLRGLRLAQL